MSSPSNKLSVVRELIMAALELIEPVAIQCPQYCPPPKLLLRLLHRLCRLLSWRDIRVRVDVMWVGTERVRVWGCGAEEEWVVFEEGCVSQLSFMGLYH
jgi:hypothetical protein